MAVSKGYEVTKNDGVLRITIARDFGNISESQEWATTITGSAIGPFHAVEIDVTHMPVLASTTIAGLIQLQDYYTRNGGATITLIGANGRVQRTMEMMKIDYLFSFA